MPGPDRWASLFAVGGLDFMTGDALLVFDEWLTIRSWNEEAEALTGVASAQAVGRPCWEVLGARSDEGALICHRGCSYARLARDSWPVRCHDVVIRTAGRPRRVALSTVALPETEPRLFLHLMHPAAGDTEALPANEVNVTPRQLQVLELIAGGLAAKAIAEQLGIAIATVRNHIHAILVELDAHSQLEAVAEARRAGLIR